MIQEENSRNKFDQVYFTTTESEDIQETQFTQNKSIINISDPIKKYQNFQCISCKKKSMSYFSVPVERITPQDYKCLVNRGFIREEKDFYCCKQSESCCHIFNTRTIVKEFILDRKFQKVLKKWEKFLNGERGIFEICESEKIKEAENEEDIDIENSLRKFIGEVKSCRIGDLDIQNLHIVNNIMNSNNSKYITSDLLFKIINEFNKESRNKDKINEGKILKLKPFLQKNKIELENLLKKYILDKKFKIMKNGIIKIWRSKHITERKNYKIPKPPPLYFIRNFKKYDSHRPKIFLPIWDPSERKKRNLKIKIRKSDFSYKKLDLYNRYNREIHKTTREDNRFSFTSFVCSGNLTNTIVKKDEDINENLEKRLIKVKKKYPVVNKIFEEEISDHSSDFESKLTGHYHMEFYLDDVLIGVSNQDHLDNGIISNYFFYEPIDRKSVV